VRKALRKKRQAKMTLQEERDTKSMQLFRRRFAAGIRAVRKALHIMAGKERRLPEKA